MTTAQAHRLVSSALQDDEQSCLDTLAIIAYRQRRNYAAYRYLFQSLQAHPDADRVAAMMRAAGFSEASYRLTGFATVAIHLARKSATDLTLHAAV